jgi:hypothetical protein
MQVIHYSKNKLIRMNAHAHAHVYAMSSPQAYSLPLLHEIKYMHACSLANHRPHMYFANQQCRKTHHSHHNINSKLPLSMKAKPPNSQAHCSQQETYVYSQAGGSLLRNSQRLGRSLEALDADMLPAPALLNLFSIPARRRLELHLLQLPNHLLDLAILD